VVVGLASLIAMTGFSSLVVMAGSASLIVMVGFASLIVTGGQLLDRMRDVCEEDHWRLE
jgi:hypothetical protein